MPAPPVHHFSIDVEDYFQVSAFERQVASSSWDSFESRVVRNTQRLLELLAESGAKATCFTVGWVAEKYPALVREMVSAGHEIASHSYWHRRVTTLTPQEFRSDLQRSKDVLEQIAGVKVEGHRAPSFSIVPGVEWAWEILVEEGFSYDSSVFPIRRAGYGNPDSPRQPYLMRTASGVLRQYPLATWRVGGLSLPAAGGAYLRLLPPFLVNRAIADAEARGVSAMCYIHPWEIDAGQPRLPVSALTRIRHYGGLAGVAGRLRQLLARHRFTAIRDLPGDIPGGDGS